MARNPIRDERQGDLFGAQAAPAKGPKPSRQTTKANAASHTPGDVAPARFAERPTRFDLEELVTGLSDGDLAHLAVLATRGLKRRLSRIWGRSSRPGPLKGRNPLERGLQDIAGELAEFGENDGAWWDE